MQFFEDTILIDTSAAIALLNPKDQYHEHALSFFELTSKITSDIVWAVLNITKHESFTRTRYNYNFNNALKLYDYLSSEGMYQLSFSKNDEDQARNLLKKFHDQKLSFHDALCATIMERYGIYKAFTFDKHFYLFGYEIYPGIIK